MISNLTVNALQLFYRHVKFNFFYLISGTEVFFTNRIVKLLVKKIVNEESKHFDYSVLYGKETNVNNIIEVARRFPLVSKYNLSNFSYFAARSNSSG